MNITNNADMSGNTLTIQKFNCCRFLVSGDSLKDSTCLENSKTIASLINFNKFCKIIFKAKIFQSVTFSSNQRQLAPGEFVIEGKFHKP